MRKNPTRAERILWQSLRANRLNGWHFRRQQIIEGFIVDFYCHLAGLVVEVDGAVHADRAGYDTERSHILESLGLKVIRFCNEEVLDKLDSVLDRINSEAEERTAPSPSEEGWGGV